MTFNEEIDVRELINQIIRELRILDKKEISFKNQLGNIRLFGNRSLLHRAFSNLPHNAMKYNKHAGSVTISGLAEEQMNIITVSDTGIGIPEDSIDKIFDSFYCADKSRSRELGGRGLGLSIVKAIIEKHNGTINI